MITISVFGAPASGKSLTLSIAEAMMRERDISVRNYDERPEKIGLYAHLQGAEVLMKSHLSHGSLRWTIKGEGQRARVESIMDRAKAEAYRIMGKHTSPTPEADEIERLELDALAAERAEAVLKVGDTPIDEADTATAPGYLIWNPAREMPRIPHPDLQTVIAEAIRLSDNNPGERFFVMVPALEYTRQEEVIRVPLPLQIRSVAQVEHNPFNLDDEIPF